MSLAKNSHYKVLSNCGEKDLLRLAELVLETYSAAKVRILNGPRQGLVMLRVEESVAFSQFNAGEVLVTEVKLELDNQFGYGMVLGHNPRRAMAVALVDAALGKGGEVAKQLATEIELLYAALLDERKKLHRAVSLTKVEFETM